MGLNDVQISGNKIEKNDICYLSVFSPNGWIPVVSSSTTKFPYMGTGSKTECADNKEAVDLGDGIIYLPVQWKDGESIPINNPIIVSEHSIKEIKADTLHCESVVLKRKYPLNMRIIDFSKMMVMGIFEGSNKSDFSDAEEIYRITKTPESQMQKVNISTDKAYRYVCYRRPKGTLSIAEFSLYRPDGNPLPFCPIACEAISEDSTMMNVFDMKPITYYQMSGGIDMWIGADLRKSVKIGAIGFAPRNDDNAIAVTDTYELFYWHNKWNSLGRKKAESDSLIYNNVPKRSLLLLRNLTKGCEERPFTYEKGRQIWW